jgi:hypothetical protein
MVNTSTFIESVLNKEKSEEAFALLADGMRSSLR